jgi:hypothetical protein
MGGGHISGIIGTTAFDQVGTQESPKLTEVERNTGSQNTKYWSDSDYARSSSEYWDQMKGLLSRFYLDENKSLGEVMDLMRSIYGFNAG